MTRIYSSNRRARLWPRVLLVLAGALAVLVILSFVRSGTESVFWRLLAPVYAARNALFASDTTELRTQLAEAQALAADREVLRVENEDLKRRLGRESSAERLLAAILQRPPESPYDTLLIDAGANLGVHEGSLVSAGGSTVIGHVTGVLATTARVTLFSAPGEEHQALVLPRTPEGVTLPINVAGKGGGVFVSEIPAGSDVKINDAVAFPGLGSTFMANVTHVDAQEGESFMLIYMKLPLNPLELRFVEILK